MRTEDGYIINKCLDGNSAAFGFLVDKYKAAVYAFAYAELRNFHDAEDVTQEVFIKAYQKLNSLRRWDNFLAWLYSITSNLCKMHVRAKSRRPDREFIEDQDSELLDEPIVDPRHENPIIELLNEALDSLPEIYRRVLTLYYLGGMNSKEIARFLGTSPTAVRHRLSRGRSQLKEGMLAMMSQTLEGQKLQASFTFRIVEAVRHIKINPMPRTAAFPWGLSLAAGIIFTVMSLSPYLNVLNPMATPSGSLLSSETRILKTGEIPMEMLNISLIQAIANNQMGDDGMPEFPKPQNTLLLAPQAEGGEWSRKADMPTSRGLHTADVVNEKIYAIGGTQNGQTALSTVEEYDPATDIWTKKANMPKVRQSLAASAVNGRIYVIGGWAGPGDFPATIEEYDPAKDKWTSKSNMPRARSELSTSVVNGKLYIIGGGHGVGNATATVEEYDPEADTLVEKTDMPTARQSLSTSVVNGRIYAIGGEAKGAPLPTVEEYDPATDIWTKKADMPTARMSLSTSVVNGKIYAIGGGAGFFGATLSIVEKYDPATDTWTREADIPTSRGAFSTSVVDGKIYAIGGATAGWAFMSSAVEEYSVDFEPEKGVEAKGKSTTQWGSIKEQANTKTQ